MGGLPRLEEIRSVSKIGLCAITIVFEDGVNDYFARQLVSERMQSVRENLPAGVDVTLGPITTGLGEVFQYTLVSNDPNYDATELRTLQDYIVRPILRTVPGVTDVNSFGGLVKQYQVIIKPERLLSHNVTLEHIFEALEKNNANASGNFIKHQSEQYVVRCIGLVKDVRDIENIIIEALIVTAAGAVAPYADLHPRCGGGENRRGTAAGCGDGQREGRSGRGNCPDAQRRERSRRSDGGERETSRNSEGAAERG
jgi:cobalt-zinc-cadmium resistance protein CzcA